MTLLDESRKAGRWFIIITQFFIFVSVVVFSLSTLPDLTIKQIHTLDTIELVVLFVFVAEYLFRFKVMTNEH